LKILIDLGDAIFYKLSLEWNNDATHKVTGTVYDPDGCDIFGFNVQGFDRKGYSQYGKNESGELQETLQKAKNIANQYGVSFEIVFNTKGSCAFFSGSKNMLTINLYKASIRDNKRTDKYNKGIKEDIAHEILHIMQIYDNERYEDIVKYYQFGNSFKVFVISNITLWDDYRKLYMKQWNGDITLVRKLMEYEMAACFLGEREFTDVLFDENTTNENINLASNADYIALFEYFQESKLNIVSLTLDERRKKNIDFLNRFGSRNYMQVGDDISQS